LLTDHLGRQFAKGQKVVFTFDGLLEADVAEVQEISLVSKDKPEGDKVLVLVGVHRIHVDAKGVRIPNIYIVHNPTEELGKKVSE
jgi:hypothetical protein